MQSSMCANITSADLAKIELTRQKNMGFELLSDLAKIKIFYH